MMANFSPAFEGSVRNEGGYKLHNVAGDRGGQTYAGIARKFWPQWSGWKIIDNGDMDNPALSAHVRQFFNDNFWDKIKGSDMGSQIVAETIYDFATNAGVRTTIKIVQTVVGVVPDGVIGPDTLRAINAEQNEVFVLKFTLAKLARYAEICNRDRSQSKFLLGWINRTMRGLS